jgi:hypothetical protein
VYRGYEKLARVCVVGWNGWEVVGGGGTGEDLKSNKKPQIYLLREDHDNGELRKSEDQNPLDSPLWMV